MRHSTHRLRLKAQEFDDLRRLRARLVSAHAVRQHEIGLPGALEFQINARNVLRLPRRRGAVQPARITLLQIRHRDIKKDLDIPRVLISIPLARPAAHLTLSLILTAAASAGAEAAEPADGARRPRPSFGAGVDVVNLNVSALEAGRGHVTDLQAADFRVFEDGVPQELTLFRHDRVPLSVALLAFVLEMALLAWRGPLP